MELKASKKELIRLVVDELKEHEKNVVEQQKMIRMDMKRHEKALGIEDGEERLMEAMNKIRDAQLGPDESKRSDAQLRAQEDTIAIVLGKKNIEDVQAGFHWVVNDEDAKEEQKNEEL